MPSFISPLGTTDPTGRTCYYEIPDVQKYVEFWLAPDCSNSLLLQITVELKNDLAISGELHSVDQYLNVKLNNVRVLNENKYPHMVSLSFPPSLPICSMVVLCRGS